MLVSIDPGSLATAHLSESVTTSVLMTVRRIRKTSAVSSLLSVGRAMWNGMDLVMPWGLGGRTTSNIVLLKSDSAQEKGAINVFAYVLMILTKTKL